MLVTLELTNMVLALVRRLSFPVQPKKAVGSIAIAKSWTPGMIYMIWNWVRLGHVLAFSRSPKEDKQGV